MIFVGDIAIGYENAIKLIGIPEHLQNKSWFGNLEGSLICDFEKFRKKNVVFNNIDAIKSLLANFKFVGFALANNHIFDVNSYTDTISVLNRLNIPYCGIGKSIVDASAPFILYENGKRIIILNFGWEVIQCPIAKKNSYGVNPLAKKHVLQTTRQTIKNFPDSKIITFMHWSYELEAEPQPFERELAKALIDLGIDGVIGCHPHRIGGMEFYKNKPLIYSLGNWMFVQNYFRNGKLKFPDFCDLELAFEWDFLKNKFYFHFFNFCPKSSTLTYLFTEEEKSPTLYNLTSFRNFSTNEYNIWYKKNHFHKNKGLPIYYWEDSELTIQIKNFLIKLRDYIIRLIVGFRI